jgi:hypothetical protein
VRQNNGGATVANLFALANKSLGGESTGGINAATINNAVDAINRGFDECRVKVIIPEETIETRSIAFDDKDAISNSRPISGNVTIYPVPFQDSFTVNYGLDYGFVLASYSKINEDTTSFNKPFGLKNFNSHLVQPSISANWMVDQYLAFTVLFSYTTMFSQFDPRAPRFNHFEKINEKSNNYFMSWFTFGFGVNVLFGKLKQK